MPVVPISGKLSSKDPEFMASLRTRILPLKTRQKDKLTITTSVTSPLLRSKFCV